MADAIDAQLKFAIKNKLNVLLSGRHGVGKTTRVLEAFAEEGIKVKYFSASTMDPFTDFVGVPHRITDDQTGEDHLGFLRPQDLSDPTIEALFFDEYNRAPKKVRNAVMEVIQFKSINGKKFPNLKYVWTAINPDDDDENKYDVEMLDGAQLDRFHMQIQVPYEVSASYFLKAHPGGHGAVAIDWWNSLTQKVRNEISPRRLDYAVQAYKDGATTTILKTILPASCNVSEFVTQMKKGTMSQRIEQAYKAKDEETMKTIMNGSETSLVIKHIDSIVGNKKKMFEFMVENLEDEGFVNLLDEFSKKTRTFLKDNKKFEDRLTSVYELDTVAVKIRKQARSLLSADVVKKLDAKKGDSDLFKDAADVNDDDSAMKEWIVYNA